MNRTRILGFITLLTALFVAFGTVVAPPATAAPKEPGCTVFRDCSARDWYRQKMKQIDTGDPVVLATLVVTFYNPYVNDGRVGRFGATAQLNLIRALQQKQIHCVQDNLRQAVYVIATTKMVKAFTDAVAGRAKNAGIAYDAVRNLLIRKGIQVAASTTLLTKAGLYSIQAWAKFAGGVAQFAQVAGLQNLAKSSFGCPLN